ncbi:MAG: hypothetical protein A3J24_04260 [Deltaproteobacteria bacterium RIFCSPLOWO2_02_FULL_53_8]|nr:MAG: hypothetical protein A3J24_04260 [Deltaproteobacteria bacterium RIFCSPLOWO2_02_FULL_53_8]
MRKKISSAVIWAVCCIGIISVFLPASVYAKPASIAVLPLQVSGDNAALLQGVALDMLQSKLSRDGGVEVVKADAVRAALEGTSGEITNIRASLAGAKLNVDYVVYGGMRTEGRSSFMDIKLLSVKDGSIVSLSTAAASDAIVSLLEAASAQVLTAVAAAMPKPLPVKADAPASQVPAPVAPTPVAQKPDDGFIIKTTEATERPAMRKSKRMDGFYKGIISADLDKDGEKEIFLLGAGSVTVGRLKVDGFDVIKEVKTPAGVVNTSVAAIDSDDDGNIEVYVSGAFNNAPSASVIEWRDGVYKVVASELPWFVRVFKDEAGASVLVGQTFRIHDGFYGGLHTLKIHNGGLVETGVFMAGLPSAADIYRMDFFDATGSGQPQAVVLDNRGYFRVYEKSGAGEWAQLYQSKDWFGGTLNLIEFGSDVIGQQKKEPLPVEGRFFSVDFNNDGKAEIVVKRNFAGGLGRYSATPSSFTDGEVVNVSWDKDAESLLENWKTKKVNGYIADFYIETDAATGVKELVMLIVEGTGAYFGGIKSYILSHRLAI